MKIYQTGHFVFLNFCKLGLSICIIVQVLYYIHLVFKYLFSLLREIDKNKFNV